jgi:hypothetical protein
MQRREKLGPGRVLSKREQEFGEKRSSEPVSTKRRACPMFGEWECSRSERSARVLINATECVDVYMLYQ